LRGRGSRRGEDTASSLPPFFLPIITITVFHYDRTVLFIITNTLWETSVGKRKIKGAHPYSNLSGTNLVWVWPRHIPPILCSRSPLHCRPFLPSSALFDQELLLWRKIIGAQHRETGGDNFICID
jgi:hypothetical protein